MREGFGVLVECIRRIREWDEQRFTNYLYSRLSAQYIRQCTSIARQCISQFYSTAFVHTEARDLRK